MGEDIAVQEACYRAAVAARGPVGSPTELL